MSILLKLYLEFFKIGLFAIGGGMATIPFLKDLGEKTGWFTNAELMNMLAVSESTPGPMGINMATYVGFTVAGIPGGIIATLGEVSPSIVVIILISMALEKWKQNRYVNDAFYGLRPASTGLIASAALGILITVLFTTAAGTIGPDVRGIVFAVLLFVLMNYVKPLKKLHPVWFIVISAAAGILIQTAKAKGGAQK